MAGSYSLTAAFIRGQSRLSHQPATLSNEAAWAEPPNTDRPTSTTADTKHPRVIDCICVIPLGVDQRVGPDSTS